MTSFATRFRRGDALLGALLRMPNEGLVELAGLVGLDYVLIDTEHGPGDQLALAHHLTAAAANGLAVIVRVGGPGEVLRVLDLGADGILAPHVSSVAQARELVDAVHYPPLGRRGFAAYTRAGAYGLRTASEHHAAARDSLLITMIEDPAGLAAAAEIAALDGVDGLMLGPADLACELGLVGRPDDPQLAAAADTVRERAHAAGVAAVSIVGSRDAARAAFVAGDSVVMYNVQLLLGQQFRGLAAARPNASADTDAGADAGAVGRTEAADGHREPLVLLPGMLGDATVWTDVAADLADIAAPRFARIDLDDSIAEMAESVLAVAPDRFSLVGHSLGAVVALEILRRAPGRVRRVALVNASGRAPSADQHAAWAALTDRLDRGGFDDVVAEQALACLPPGRRTDHALVAAGERMARAVGEAGLRRQLRAQHARTSYLDDLGTYDLPVLLVSGALDEVCPPERQQELRSRCPGARLATLEDAGHLAPLERPAQVAAHLRAWLAG